MSQFNAASTADDVLRGKNLSGKRFLITGVSAGLGTETARALVARGADVIGTVRDLGKGDRATAAVRDAARAAGGSFNMVTLHLDALASVRVGADALLADGRPFDGVIANAGVMATPFGKTVDGFETQFGTNHLGHFVLINRIASLIKPGGRFVSLSSAGHRFSDVDLEDPNFERTEYTPFGAYGRSKTANILFAVAFDKRYRDKGIRAAAVHPGGIQTELSRHMDPAVGEALIRSIDEANAAAGLPPFRYKSVPQGAATSVWAAVTASAETIGGRYCEDCHVAEPSVSSAARAGVQSYALDSDRAEALWALSESMVGQAF